ncbi:hypothetical protein TNCV_880531 [Trichonephila clavipes]|nr:hypothetical protein TNCV_880531 [Trichonephila clavipes]
MEMNKEIGLTNGTGLTIDLSPDGTGMDQSLPSSRPGTPQLTSSQRKQECVALIDFYTQTIENIKANMKQLQTKEAKGQNNPILFEHIFKEHEQRAADYSSLLEITVSPTLSFVKYPAVQLFTPHLILPLKVMTQNSPLYRKRLQLKERRTKLNSSPLLSQTC